MSTDVRAELATLAAALRAHLDWCRATGAMALPPATPELRAGRGESTAAPASVVVGEAAREKGALRRLSEAASPRAVAPPPAGGDTPTGRSPAVASARESRGPTALVSASASAEERRAALGALAQEVSGCTACALSRTRTQTVFARGEGDSGVCFVGEGPGAEEDARGLPFVGAAGQLLDRMIAAMGLRREEVYVCNIVKCRPPENRRPEPEEVRACEPWLLRQLELVEPKVIVALGATAVTGLFGSTVGITKLRGRWKLWRGVPVMPTFHPAYLLRQPAAKREVWQDLQEVLRQLGREPPPRAGG